MTARRPAIALLALLGFLLASPAPASHAAKGPSYGDVTRAARALEEWRYEEAATLIAAMEKQAPKAPETRYLAGQLAFYQGEYVRAEQLFAGLDGKSDPGVLGWQTLARTTREATAGMVSRESPKGRFVIWYTPGKDEILVELAGEALDAQWEALAADLGYTPPGKVRVEILPKVADLARVSPLSLQAIEGSGTIALCKYNKLMIVTPRATLLGYPWLDTLAHEYTHYVVTRATDDKVPIWLHEGLAKYQESRWRAAPGQGGMGHVHEHLLALALKKGRLVSFEEMHPSLAYLPSQVAATAYAEVYAFVDYVQLKGGYAAVRAALASMKDGKSEKRALAEALGLEWQKLEAAWKKHLKGLDLRIDPRLGAEPEIVRLKKSEGDEENVGLEQIQEEKARKHARLGGLLRARGRLKAAAIEYEKALAIAGAGGDPFLTAKLARTYLELGESQKAIDLLEAVPDRDPEDAGAETTLGTAYLRLGRAPEAEAHLTAALRVQPFDPEVRCGLAEIYEPAGDARAKREKQACQVARSGAP